MPKPRTKARQPITPRQAMALAIRAARAGVKKGQSPFGCVIVRQGKVVARAHNTVWQSCDATAHAEVNAIRQACCKLGTIDLSGCTLYTTCEPCPMCYSAAHWARVSRIVYGAEIADAQAAGFNELVISAERMRKFSGDEMELVPDFMRNECRELFAEWKRHGRGRAY